MKRSKLGSGAFIFAIIFVLTTISPVNGLTNESRGIYTVNAEDAAYLTDDMTSITTGASVTLNTTGSVILFSEREVVPESLVSSFGKTAVPVPETETGDEVNFRTYDVTLNFDVNQAEITEDGTTISERVCTAYKITGNTYLLFDLFATEAGNGGIYGVYLKPGMTYYIKLDGEYIELRPNVFWNKNQNNTKDEDPVTGYPTGDNCYIYHLEDPYYRGAANIWIPAFDYYNNDGTVNPNASFDVTYNRYLRDNGLDSDDGKIYISLPTSTFYTDITDVVITDTLPNGFDYVYNDVNIVGSDNSINVEVDDNKIKISIYGTICQKGVGESPYSITYRIRTQNNEYPEGEQEFKLDAANMSYRIVGAGNDIKSSGNAYIDIPPLFSLELTVDPEIIWEGASAELMPAINILGNYPPDKESTNGWKIPESWLYYYDTDKYAKTFYSYDGDIKVYNIPDSLLLENVRGKGVKKYGFTAKMPNDYYEPEEAVTSLIVVEGKLTVKMIGKDETTKGLFDALINYSLGDSLRTGQFSFGADLNFDNNYIDSREYSVNQDSVFNAAAYVPYGYEVEILESDGVRFILDDEKYNLVESDYLISKTINLNVNKIASPWFRDWAWKKTDDTYDSEVETKKEVDKE